MLMQSQHVSQSNQTGFTLIELLVSLTVLVVLISLSMPSMQHLWAENRVDAAVNNLMSGLYYARSEAITRDENIVFCKSTDQKTCGGYWREGQIVRDQQGNILRVFSELPKTDALYWNSSGGKDEEITWSPTGYTNGQRGSFYYCVKNAGAQSSRTIVLLDTGRLYAAPMSEADYQNHCLYARSP